MDYLTAFETASHDVLTDFVSRGQEENIHLDFKLVSNPAMTAKDDKRNLAKALSGFSNSSGGLIVWGVDARKNSEGIDCAVELRPIEQPSSMLSRLNSLTREAVDPTVKGVQHRSVLLKDGTGFILSLIPESETGPHMAKLGEDRYYKRSGDSFYKMEHFDVADMFGKRRRPRLYVTYRVALRGAAGVEIILGLANDGRATANSPFVAFGCDNQLFRSHYGLDGNGHEGLTFLYMPAYDLPWSYGGANGLPIHPGMSHEVMRLVQRDPGGPARPRPTADLAIQYAVAAGGSTTGARPSYRANP